MRLALAAVAALAVAAAGCGGVENDPNLAKAAERTEATGSFALEVTARYSFANGEVEMSCEGVVDSAGRRSHIVCKDPEGVSETIIVQGATYRKYRGTAEKWWKSPTEDYEAPEELTPEKILGLLRSASRKTERAGEEDVRGEPTVRYALTVDCKQAEFIECADETAVVDVWIDRDGLVRRIAFDEEGDEESMTASIEFFGFGLPVDVEAPSAGEVTESPPPHLIGPCTPEKAGPIGVSEAVEALRRHGFDVKRDDFGCGRGVAASLTNVDDGDFEGLLRGEGVLSCFVFTAEHAGKVEIGALVPPGGPLPQPVERQFENFVCSLSVDGRQAKDRIASLDAALAELTR